MQSESHSIYVHSKNVYSMQIRSDVIVTSEFHSVFHGVTDLAKFNYYNIASCIFISCYSKSTGGKI